MNVRFYLNDRIAAELDKAAKLQGQSRSDLLRTVLREWLDLMDRGNLRWPDAVLEWSGDPNVPPFESYRGELLSP